MLQSGFMNASESADSPFIVVGAGVAGLTCALHLHDAGRAVIVLEGSDGVGGRVRTDTVDGFRLDRGFQVLLDSYPECRAVLDYDALALQPFFAGAQVFYAGEFHTVADPWRHPIEAAKGFLSPISTFADKARLGKLGLGITGASLEKIWSKPDKPTIEVLHDAGMSGAVIDRFFRPFFGGVFFDRDLKTSRRMFEFCFKMFASGHATVPANGMQAIPDQLASRLPKGAIRLNSPVASVNADGVVLRSGERIVGQPIIATDMDQANELLGIADRSSREWNGTITLHYSADRAPIERPVLCLDGEGTGPINHLAVMSNAAPTYAPEGKALIAANIVGVSEKSDAQLDADAKEQLTGWFGEEARAWILLRVDRIPHALPRQTPGVLEPVAREFVTDSSVIVCGDHLANTSLNGAMESGRRASELALRAG